MSKKTIVVNIGYEDAAKYLHAIEDPQLQEYFSLYTGGTFKAEIIKEWRKGSEQSGAWKRFSGLMFWFCMDSGNLYFAVEPKYDFQYPKNLPPEEYLKWVPELGLLPIPGHFFNEDISDLTLEEKIAFLQRHGESPFSDSPSQPWDVIKRDIESFRASSISKNFHKYPFAYFVSEEGEKKYFDSFFDSGEVEYVRYYVGFDNGDYPNKLRLILVPADKDGNNIVAKDLTEDYLLQKSWPPPPNT